MTRRRPLRHPPPPGSARIGVVGLLASALLMTVAGAASAQSDALLQTFQRYDDAKAANRIAEALAYGDEAMKLSESEGVDPEDQVRLLRDMGDVAAQAGKDSQSLAYYVRSLNLEEAYLGPEHPDLVQTLSALADLHIKARRFAEAAALLQRIVKIEREAYGDTHENVEATLVKLRDLYRAAHDSQAAAAVEAELQPAAASKRRLAAIKGGVTVESKRYALKNGFASVRVFYGTNRVPTGEAKPALLYGRASGPLQYGYLDVTIPQTHKLAELETPKQWSEYTLRVLNTDMRSQFVLLDNVKPLSREDFVERLRQEIQSSPSKDVFIFVHGYNNSFEDTARRTAQLAYDLDFDGTPLMYSWPSQGTLGGYFGDEGVIDASGRHLAEFLGTLAAQSGAGRIHMIAHSMGNRVLLAALKQYLPAHASDKRARPFGQVVFTAPDVDRGAFIAAFESLRGSADRLTLYASDTDVALRLSRYYHGEPRAGSAGPLIIKLKGLDTIDVSGLPADVLGHSYFAANGGTVYDLLHLLWRGDAPDSPQRCSTGEGPSGSAVVVWRFNVSKCQGSDLLEAAMLLKEYRDQGRAQILKQVSDQIAALTEPAQKQAAELIFERLNLLLAAAGQPTG